uniref:Sema domain-containing protein n=1 Tax=Parascaris equorum TaxID=6256 RepID=A0A914RQC3_PAREQ
MIGLLAESAVVLCGKDVNSYIGGDIAIEARPVLTTKDARFSAIATNTTRANTVAFIGTYDGRLLKAVIENRTAGFLYRTLEIGGGKPVLQDLELDGTGDHVYVLTPSSAFDWIQIAGAVWQVPNLIQRGTSLQSKIFRRSLTVG